ncbi:MAG: phosphatidylglycerol lysyltransferase domain-containing protein [Eubacteriales bacterium]|nr:phosphatidylglycerol lysyltransferase domain-containing protein [Eubacteriales bacterium]
MLNFRPITLQDKEEVQKYFNPEGIQICEYCFTDLFIWKDHYDTEICFQDDFLFVRMKTFPDKVPMYLMPIGFGDLEKACHTVMADADERGEECLICSIPEEKIPEMNRILSDDYEIKLLDGCWDYIYKTEKIQTFSGKKLQSKRNFINRFCKQYDGHWSYEDITDENTDDAYQLHLKWCEEDASACAKGMMYSGETCAVRIALDNREALGLHGGLLRLDDEPIAFTLGSPANRDTYIIQIEKADSQIPGAYPMIAQQFAQHNCTDYAYINREEDLGKEGLRKSKKSYRPVKMAGKYTAVRKDTKRFADWESVKLEEL